jgi:hypothetical protein
LYPNNFIFSRIGTGTPVEFFGEERRLKELKSLEDLHTLTLRQNDELNDMITKLEEDLVYFFCCTIHATFTRVILANLWHSHFKK